MTWSSSVSDHRKPCFALIQISYVARDLRRLVTPEEEGQFPCAWNILRLAADRVAVKTCTEIIRRDPRLYLVRTRIDATESGMSMLRAFRTGLGNQAFVTIMQKRTSWHRRHRFSPISTT